MQKNKLSKAFSLVELSIVILVVGILLAAITKGKDLYSDMQLKTAQSVTSSSLINSMKSVSLWLDTTTISNIRDANKIQLDFDNNVHFWRDNKVSSLATLIELQANSTANTDATKPLLIRNGLGGLPSIQFDGNNYFTLNNATKSPLTDNDDTYSIAIVMKSNHLQAASGTPISIGATTNHFAFNITSNTAAEISQGTGNTQTFTHDSLRKNIYIFVVNNNNANNVKIYNNSDTSTDIATTTPSSSSLIQGRINVAANLSDTPGYNGQISEIIVFNNELSQKEVEEINDYFKQKYNIPIN